MSNAKKCVRCHELKSLSNFTKIQKGKYYFAYCKPCASIRVKEYYAANPDKKALLNQKKRAYAQSYRKDHKEKITSYYKEWYKRTNRYRPRKTVSE